MNPEDFEKKLSQRPVRPLPPEWRAEILSAARAAAPQPAPPTTSNIFATIARQLSGLLQLRPQALAGLAAVWILIFALRFSTQEGSTIAANCASVSPEVIAGVREQKLFFAELVGLREKRETEPPKSFSPGPRSELRHPSVRA